MKKIFGTVATLFLTPGLFFTVSRSTAQALEVIPQVERAPSSSESQNLDNFDARLGEIQFQVSEDRTFAETLPIRIAAPDFFSKIAVILRKVSGEQLGEEEVIFSQNQGSMLEIPLPLKFGEGEYSVQIGARNDELSPKTRYRFVSRQIRVVQLQAKEESQRVNFNPGAKNSTSGSFPNAKVPEGRSDSSTSKGKGQIFLEKSEIANSRVRILGEVPEGIKFLIVKAQDLQNGYSTIVRDFELKSRKVNVETFLKGGAGEYDLSFYGARTIEEMNGSIKKLKASSLFLGSARARNSDPIPKGIFLASPEPSDSLLKLHGFIVDGETEALVKIVELDESNNEICNRKGTSSCKKIDFGTKAGEFSKLIPLPGPGRYDVEIFLKKKGKALFNFENAFRVKNEGKKKWGIWVESTDETDGKVKIAGRFLEEKLDFVISARKISGNNKGRATKQTLRVVGGVFSESFDLNLGPGEYEVEVGRMVDDKFFVVENEFLVRSLRSEEFDFLNSTQKINFRNEEFQDFINGIVGKEKIDEKMRPKMIEKGLRWISENIEYNQEALDLNEFQNFQTVTGTMSFRKGKCVEYSRLAVAFLRGIGVQSRVVKGHLVPQKEAGSAPRTVPKAASVSCSDIFWNHAWIQYKADGKWVDVEPATAGAIDPDRYIPVPPTCSVE